MREDAAVRKIENVDFLTNHAGPGDAWEELARDIKMNTPVSPDSNRRLPSAVPYAVLTPILAVMAHSAWMVQRGASTSSLGLLIGIFIDPLALFSMVAIIMLTSTFIRPFVENAFSRWVAFLLCVVGLTLALKLLIPELAK